MTDKKRKEDEEKKDKERNELQKAWDDLLNLHKLVSRWLLFVFFTGNNRTYWFIRSIHIRNC
ncbi:MAG: hypothetical protein B6U87_02215 [Candidatus Aenigmarchaeota archaeon ex4484_52]|nr:MAG: hypothetical protein B6U87_02215 [Candidatus Aenigmarchaeota archaeon ex4484_52]